MYIMLDSSWGCVASGGLPEAGEADGEAGDEDLRGIEMRYQPLGRPEIEAKQHENGPFLGN